MTDSTQIGLIYNSQLPDIDRIVRSLLKSLESQAICWRDSADQITIDGNKIKNTSFVITAGGDGTILRAVRVTAPFGVPIVGINLGRIGFLTELELNEAIDKLPMYLTDKPRLENRMMLQVQFKPQGVDKPRLTWHGLNDVVVGNTGVTRVLNIDVSVDHNIFTTYRSDAVIVSTATGSTGYALSAGGPILNPDSKDMLIQPVAAHTGLVDGVVLPSKSTIELKIKNNYPTVLAVDGFQEISLKPNDEIIVTRSKYVAKFLRFSDPGTFYETLTKRLGLRYSSP